MVQTRVVALTLTLLAAVASAVEATPFAFDQVYYFHDATPLGSSVGANNAIRVQISSIDQPFGLSVSAIEETEAEFALEAGAFAGTDCLSFLDDHNCIEYNVKPTGSGTYMPPILITIAWLLDTNSIAPSPLLIQAEGNDPFSTELRDQMYFAHSTDGIPFCHDSGDDGRGKHCEDDPAETGSTDNFSRFAVLSSAPVPEPGTLLLVGSGVVTALWRRRRQRRRA
jgi:hypothetical protein